MKRMLFICFLLAGAVFAGSQNENLMPTGFDQVHLGMTWRSLVHLRPDAEIMNMMPDPGTDLNPDPENPKTGLVERLSSESFDLVMYNFEDGVLVAVMFAKKESNASSSERDDLLREVATKRGMPSQIEMLDKERDMGVLTWKDQSVQVNVITPLIDLKSEKGVLGLQIMNRKYAERIKALGTPDKTGKITELQSTNKSRSDAIRAEIQRIISTNRATAKE